MTNLDDNSLEKYYRELDNHLYYITELVKEQKLEAAAVELGDLHYADIADFIDNLSKKLLKDILPIISDNLHPETLVCINNTKKQEVVEILGIRKSAYLIDNLDIEDAIEVIENLEPEIKQEVLENLEYEQQQKILEGFNYPENTVGRILEKDFIVFKENWNVGYAIDSLRRVGVSKDFYAAIIINNKYEPVGNILVSSLLRTPRNTQLSELMNSKFKKVDAYTEINDLVFIFKQYALTIVPVVTKTGKLLGTVSIDNMVYIIQEQTENEFMHLGGVHDIDIFANLYLSIQQRFPWLFVNLVSAFVTSMIINQFTSSISKLVILATIMPIVASMGGNVGSQTMTLHVRALSNREITNVNVTKNILKEIFICLVNGIMLAIIGGIITYILFSNIKLSIIFCAAVIINFIFAGLFGSCIPIILDNMSIDPATASGVLITALTDAFGFLSFLGLAYLFLV
ncbi:magnesium transporter [Rickettsia endosymbiont of Cardiosporidium cionae]|uniref:magnesium transporter n=1 Tax=Rickettsia endosymbiont of Cardiosporidium cionae TaxID=2777155 RepID=UPI0018963576|nr:magnesium transporter [Rickettsia endosymbiont of Cardiosporidium cionae]KAF8818558.1 magnesium transporter [Rickettsia endosymbiont of Cardiosporidium cionae]